MDWILLGIPIGAVMLYLGSEWMVKGAKGLAYRLGVSPLVIGITIVALGTSSPECVTSLVSGESPQIIIGNIVGSNIANVGLTLGLTAVVGTIAVEYRDVRMESFTMLAALLMVVLMSLDGKLSMADGAVLLCGLLVFIVGVYRYRTHHAEGSEFYTADVDEDRGVSAARLAALLVVGAVLLYLGARFFIDGSKTLADLLGVSEMVIGLIVVALGAALPETCISLVAARRGETEIALANILGSIIFNSLFALGVGAVLTDIPITDSMMLFHLPFMLFMGAAMYLLIRTRERLTAGTGFLLVSVYAVYIAMMYLNPGLTV